MNGEHEVRLERIEARIDELHEKVDGLVETGAVNEADIVWLKWGLRLVLVAMVGVGGMSARALI